MPINPESSRLWLKTPTILSNHLSSLLGCDVYLKLENLQPSQSFKYRGMSLFAQHCKEKYGPSAHLIIASGGNAGLAASSSAKSLGLQCTVYIPEGVTQTMLDYFKKEGAEVIVAGDCYLQALDKAEEAVRADPAAIMVPAYDDPLVWEGHASIVEEIASQIPEKPAAIFCSVGGGGLLGGVITGCKTVGWDDVNIVALETHGSACFYHSVSANPGRWHSDRELPEGISISFNEQHKVKLAHISKLNSRASSLGASSPSPGVVRMALDRTGGVTCVTVTDEMSMQTCALFAEDHKLMVELACATTLVPAYKPSIFSRIRSLQHPGSSDAHRQRPVVFIVCGGVKISLNEMEECSKVVGFGLDSEGVRCNGEYWGVPE